MNITALELTDWGEAYSDLYQSRGFYFERSLDDMAAQSRALFLFETSCCDHADQKAVLVARRARLDRMIMWK